MLSNKKIFITGGAGFIASKLIERLVEDNEIVVFDNFYRDTISGTGLGDHDNVTIVKGDVLDLGLLKSAMKGCTHIVHAAGIAGIDTVIKSPVRTMRVNTIGTANVLEAASELDGIERVIDFSTSEVFGPMAFRTSESDQTVAGSAGEARWVYAVSKLAGEHLAHAYYAEQGLPVVTLRPFNVYGPGQTGEGAIRIFINNALQNKDIRIDGDGTQIRAWCYVDDFVECLEKCIENEAVIGKSINIGNSRAVTTILGLANIVVRVLGSKSKIVHDEPLSADIAIRIPNTDLATDLLGFKASVDLEEGILKTAEWLKQQQ